MRQDNYYNILGVPFHANSVEIKKAYRRKALLYHPDKHNNDASKAAKFQLVQIAYETLSDTIRRTAYNRRIFSNQDKVKIKHYQSAQELIEAAKVFNKTLSLQNEFFINRDWLINECLQIIANENQQLFTDNSLLKTALFKEQSISFEYLQFKEVKQFEMIWLAFANDDQELIRLIQQFFSNKKNQSLWENNKALFAVLIGAIITLFIMKG
jgi:curved DNA-binding protein CbpA